MPPQNVLYYVPAQRAWVKSEVEELIEVSLYGLPVFCAQDLQLRDCKDPETLALTFYKPACSHAHFTSHPAASCSCLTCLVLLLQEANRIFGAIDAALKATEEVAATGTLLTQQGEPAPSAATSQGVASPGSSQSADPSDKLYGSSPEKAAKAQPAGISPPKENSMAGPQDEQAAVPDLSNHKSTAAESAGKYCLIQDCMQETLTCGFKGP